MNETNHERWTESIAAYMLGSLDPTETAELERHAESCERCQAEIRWLLPALDALPESVERIEPPAELRTRLLTEVRAEAGAPRPEPERRGLLTRLRGRSSRPLLLRPAVGLAALAVAVAVVVGLSLGGDSGEGGGGTITAGKAPGVVARMVPEGDRGTLHLTNVKPLPEERVLEAWVQRGGDVYPVRALFVPDHEGRATTTIADMDGVEVVMVTTEPPGGNEAPTSAPIVTLKVPG